MNPTDRINSLLLGRHIEDALRLAESLRGKLPCDVESSLRDAAWHFDRHEAQERQNAAPVVGAIPAIETLCDGRD